MRINTIEIQNFRKLKSCKIEFGEKETIFVGANNSGKTTAMDALMIFLKTKTFRTQDFTLSNWKELNLISRKWANPEESEDEKSITSIEKYLPTLDLWVEVENNELHYVSHIIPSLDWKGGLLGVRLRYEPKNMDDLIKDFTLNWNKSNQLLKSKPEHIYNNFKLWPKDFWDFCERKLSTYFTLKTYLLDPEKYLVFQDLSERNMPLDGDVLKGLIKIDIINAQRGFSDVNTDNIGNNIKNLSSQLRAYYDKHLNPLLEPTEADLDALLRINKAQSVFDENLRESFKTSLSELERLNYPGFGNPQIQLSTKISTSDGLQHDSVVQYFLEDGLSLPEKYNGLGYQNLISIIFKLIRFRDEWMRVGKDMINSDDQIEPLHLVLIEEPEAHLHAQVQQVFIKKAYDVLRKNEYLGEKKDFTTQLVVSTHSSYIAHQKFLCLRYFKRNIDDIPPTSEVINLSTTFGNGLDTTKRFVIRYLNTTHNDLFFADAVILVEGPAERILIPHFIKHGYDILDHSYITVLEIGGSHAHRLKPLIERLGITCLIITDIDSEFANSKCRPQKGKGLTTNNDTLKSWHPRISEIDRLLDLTLEEKVTDDLLIRVAYQNEINIEGTAVYPYTFEDALVLENLKLFKTIVGAKGLLKKMVNAANKNDIKEAAQDAYDAINAKSVKKAEFALEVLYLEDPEKIVIPEYIKDGLNWLKIRLSTEKNTQ